MIAMIAIKPMNVRPLREKLDQHVGLAWHHFRPEYDITLMKKGLDECSGISSY